MLWESLLSLAHEAIEDVDCHKEHVSSCCGLQISAALFILILRLDAAIQRSCLYLQPYVLLPTSPSFYLRLVSINTIRPYTLHHEREAKRMENHQRLRNSFRDSYPARPVSSAPQQDIPENQVLQKIRFGYIISKRITTNT